MRFSQQTRPDPRMYLGVDEALEPKMAEVGLFGQWQLPISMAQQQQRPRDVARVA